jgi:hypothetical protein
MSTILYGNLSVAIVDEAGTRIDRARARPTVTDLLRPRRADGPTPPPILGRNRELSDAFSAIHDRRPVEFHATCGFGKTTLLQSIVATAAARGIAQNCLYLRMDSDRVDDLLHQLVTAIFSSIRPVKLTPDQCAQVLGQVSGIIVIDDISAGPDQVSYLLDVTGGCDLVLGAGRPVLGRRGTSQDLAGLPDETALALIVDGLGRPLRDEERPVARHLVDAVDGQPLHLRQAAALVREGGYSIESLARHVEDDPDALDRLSVNGLAEVQRRALAVLALIAGALVPADIVEAIATTADLGEFLDSLYRRGLVERHADRFGLPVCKAASYRQMLLKYLGLAAAARELSAVLTARDPSASESGPAADAALSVIEYAADQGDWETVASLAKAAEAVLFLAGRWEAWKHVLRRGLDAAKAIGDSAAEAFFCHQLGSLAFCQDQLDDALRLLEHALDLREQLGDQDGVERTRHNLRLLQAPAPPPRGTRTRTRPRRRRLPVLAGAVGALVLAAGSAAIAGTLHHGGADLGAPSGPTVTVTTAVAATSAPPTSASPAQTPTTSGPTTRVATITPSTTVLITNVVGLSQEAATTTLQAQGFTVTAGTTTDCTEAEDGTVVTQSPAGGSSAVSGSAVGIAVCAASLEVTVPEVVGQQQEAATTTLKGQGFTVTAAATAECTKDEIDLVMTQSPAGGSSADSGSAVSISVCRL